MEEQPLNIAQMEEFGFYKAKETWSPKVMKKVIKEAENDYESHLKDGAENRKRLPTK